LFIIKRNSELEGGISAKGEAIGRCLVEGEQWTKGGFEPPPSKIE
jgi:hypothetical protein